MIIDKDKKTEEEIAAEEAESRRSTSEGQYAIILEDKKRVTQEVEDLQTTLKNTQDAIDSANVNLADINTQIADNNTLAIETVQNLEDLKSQKSIAEKNLEEYIITATAEKTKLDIDYLEKQKDLENKKQSLVDEISSLEKIKNDLNTNISDITKNLEKIGIQQEEETKKVSELQNTVLDLAKEVASFEPRLLILDRDEESLEQSIQDKSTQVIELDTAISAKNTQIFDLDSSIQTKQQEYDTLEKKLFNIADREDKLQAKEEFIKAKYERAGVTWEE